MKHFLTSWFSRHSLNFKLNLCILTCVCVGFLGLAIFISQYCKPIISSEIEANAQMAINAYASDFTYLVTDAERIVTSTKNTLEQTSETDTNSLKMVLNAAIKTIEHSKLSFANAWVYVFSPDDVSQGDLYVSTYDENRSVHFHEEHINDFYEQFPWFKEVPKEEKIYWSEPYIYRNTQKIMVSCLLPFKFDNKDDFDGLVALTIDLTNIQSSIRNFSFYSSGRILLLSRTGMYVTHPNPDIALKMTIFDLAKRIGLPELDFAGHELQAGRSGHMHLSKSSVFNKPVIFFYAPIKHIKWGIFLVYAQAEFLQPIREFQIIIAVALIISILLLFLIINRICHHSTTQFMTLCDIATQYGNANFQNSFTDMPSSSDIGMLASALKNMRTNLLSYIRKERIVVSEKQKNLSELDIARHIQKSALQTKYPEHRAFDIHTLMLPARQVGGDFYDFFFIDENKFAIVIADVSGKGIPAALYMMKALTLIKNISKGNLPPEVVFEHTNKQLYEGNDTCMFVTAFMGVIDLKNGEMQYVNAGHNPPLIGRTNDGKFLKPKANIVLGIRPQVKFISERLLLAPNTHILLYTDGVTEAENPTAKFFGEKRLLKIWQKALTTGKNAPEFIFHEIQKFAKGAPQSDDITMLEFIFKTINDSRLIVDADTKQLRNVLGFISNALSNNGVHDGLRFNMVTAAEEIFSNIASYAYKDTNMGLVEISYFMRHGSFYIQFKDNGIKYNPLLQEAPDISSDFRHRDVGGLGIFLAKKLSDEFTYRRYQKQNITTIGVSLL